MFGIGMSEMLVICGVALLVFGPNELPQIAKKIARGMREVRRASDDLRRSIDIDDDDDVKPARVAPPSITGSALTPQHEGDDVADVGDGGFGGYGGNDAGNGDDNVLAGEAPAIVAANAVAAGSDDAAAADADSDENAAVVDGEPARG